MLKVFCEVARTGSFLAASKNLTYAQSHISTKMQQLESDLDTTLFYGNNRGVTLTPKGKQFLSYADKILSLTEQAEMAMRDDDVATGELKIGTLETLAQMTLPDILSGYHAENPEVSLSIFTRNSSSLIDDVLNRKLDLAIIAGGISHPDLKVIPYGKEKMSLITDKHQKGQHVEKILQNNTLLVFQDGCYYRAILEQYLREKGMPAKDTIAFNSSGSIIANLCAGFGVNYLPAALIEQSAYRDLLSLHFLPAPYDFIQTYIIYRKDRYADAAFSLFLNKFDGVSFLNHCRHYIYCFHFVTFLRSKSRSDLEFKICILR